MDLIVHDEYINDASDFLKEQENNLSEAIYSYIKTMKKVKDNGIMSGETADALEAFIEQVEMTNIKVNKPEDLANQTENYLTSFVNKIDKADKHLF